MAEIKQIYFTIDKFSKRTHLNNCALESDRVSLDK